MSPEEGKAIFSLKRPCADCPFRSDVAFYLHAKRRAEIARQLRAGEKFACHKTVTYTASGNAVAGPTSKMCAGAMIALERTTGPNLFMLYGQMLGFYDSSRLDWNAPVIKLEDFERCC
ncbi:hypothetical protein SAMN05421823_11916 [Catalinimonas alkaloidigena]|uniref:Uncharacterized protein n=1 Tax=Catalinimonas alkaloidigena TaxID=1075417 RepID=A0A1G9V500_9BACT|nr:hypothetical protein [Catalinimonas alkaloidigena]SDM67157.1 hypothetical protein SAMN05421823_11916 [Catalinimonas alkaloidigena]